MSGAQIYLCIMLQDKKDINSFLFLKVSQGRGRALVVVSRRYVNNANLQPKGS